MKTHLRKGRHSVTVLYIHLVFVTKYRAKLFQPEGLETLELAFNSVARKMDFKIVEFNGESDHVHALIEYPPKLSVSQIVNSLKGVSSRRYGQHGFPKPYGKTALWSPSYFAIAVGGAPISVLKTYIQNQKKRDNAVLGVSPMSDCRKKPS